MPTPISFVPGTGKEQKATYLIGTEKIPAAAITRLLKNLEGFSGAKLDRAFYQGLSKHAKALDMMEAYNISPASAVEAFKKLQEENRPAKATSDKRATKIERAAKVFAKGICKRFKGTPEEMVAGFLELVAKPEFKKESVDVIAAYEKNFGKSSMGFVKTSARKGNPAAQKALAKARAGRKK